MLINVNGIWKKMYSSFDVSNTRLFELITFLFVIYHCTPLVSLLCKYDPIDNESWMKVQGPPIKGRRACVWYYKTEHHLVSRIFYGFGNCPWWVQSNPGDYCSKLCPFLASAHLIYLIILSAFYSHIWRNFPLVVVLLPPLLPSVYRRWGKADPSAICLLNNRIT